MHFAGSEKLIFNANEYIFRSQFAFVLNIKTNRANDKYAIYERKNKMKKICNVDLYVIVFLLAISSYLSSASRNGDSNEENEGIWR